MCVRIRFGYLYMKEIIMQPNIFKNIVQKFLQGKASKQEKKLLENFEKRMINKNQNRVFPFSEIEKKIHNEISTEVFRTIEKPSYNWKRWVAVASFLVFLSCGVLYLILNTNDTLQEQTLQSITISTPENEERTIFLEDSTKVVLSSGSSLTHPQKFSNNIREVSLKGEAFFEVTRNKHKPFVVKSGAVSTEVLGTSFNIKAFQEQKDVRVTLISGKVNIHSKDSQKILSPGEQLVYEKQSNTTIIKKIDIKDFLDMKNGILRFNDATLTQVVEKLENFYNVNISTEVKNEENCRVTGTFNNEKLDVVLKQILFVHQQLSQENINSNYIVIKGVCN